MKGCLTNNLSVRSDGSDESRRLHHGHEFPTTLFSFPNMNPRVWTAWLSILPCFALADGPADNIPDKVRPIPPPGIAIGAADRAELAEGVLKLCSELDALRDALQKQPALLARLPDVILYHKAVDWALRYDGFYKTN